MKDFRAKAKRGIIVRRAENQDAERICEIGDWTKEMFDESSYRIMVAEVVGRLVGFIDSFIDVDYLAIRFKLVKVIFITNLLRCRIRN